METEPLVDPTLTPPVTVPTAPTVPVAPTVPEVPAVPTVPAVPEVPAAPAVGELPYELRGWNWGAFVLSWIWGIANKTYISLLVIPLSFIPFFGLGMSIYLGIKGNELAWTNRQFTSLDQFRQIQKTWSYWGIALFASTCLLIVPGILATMVITQLGSATVKAHDATRKADLFELGKVVNQYKLNMEADASGNAVNYVLPNSLAEIEKQTNSSINLLDPTTKEPYSFSVSGQSYVIEAKLQSDSPCASKIYQVSDLSSGCKP